MDDGNSPRRWPSLLVLTCVYVVGELSHFLLGIVTRPMSQDIHYGDMGCLANGDSVDFLVEEGIDCFEANSSSSCVELGQHPSSNDSACFWDYSGLGLQYQILAGPAFVAVFTISGVIIAMISDRHNRRNVVAACLILLTIATALTGVANSYWQLVLFRMSIGAGESSYSPACSSMISDMFSQERRGLALGIFNWGIYFGYGLSYAVGNFVTQADIAGMGWRFSYFITGGLGFVVIILLFTVVTEPPRKDSGGGSCAQDFEIAETSDAKWDAGNRSSVASQKSSAASFDTARSKGIVDSLLKGESGLGKVGRVFRKPSIILLMIAASVRHTAGFTWAYNTQLYFTTYYPSYNLGIWITAISIVGGTLGVASGGFVSDKLVKKLGLKARLYVLAASQFIATPFAAGVLYLAPPYAFYSLLGSYLFAEMWFGVLFAVLLEMVEPRIQSTTLAIFLFVMNNIGGNAPVLIEPLRKSLSYRSALFIMYPGFYLLSSLLFLVTSFFIDNKPKIKLFGPRI